VLTRSLDQLFFQAVAISHLHCIKLFQLIQQLLSGRSVMTVTPSFGDDLALQGHKPLGFGNVPRSLRQKVQYRGPVHGLCSDNAQ
jgi:hypothetical protein